MQMTFPETLGGAAKRAAYGASQLARIAWFTGHYAAGRRRMGPEREDGRKERGKGESRKDTEVCANN